jgi:divalent metal cation (Fe/Co/Zn/Cd) transporter
MQARIVRELERGKVERVIHIRTQYLSPEELLVAAKIALVADLPLEDVAQAIDDAELRVREQVPVAKLIYLEPDLYRGHLRTPPTGDGPVASQA